MGLSCRPTDPKIKGMFAKLDNESRKKKEEINHSKSKDETKKKK